MAEAGAAEVFDRARIDPVVLTEDEATRQLRLTCRHAAAKRLLGTAPDGVAVGQGKDRHRRDAKQDEPRWPAPAHVR